MSRHPVPFAPETLESIRRAFRLATDRRHDLVSLEHLLSRAAGGSAGAARAAGVAAWTSTVLRSRSRGGAATRVLAGARAQGRQARVHHRLRSRRRARGGARRLVQRAAGGERRACWCSCCRRTTATPPTSSASRGSIASRCCGRSRIGAARAADGRPAPEPETSGPREPLEAYATDLVARAARGQIDPLIGRAARARAHGPGAVPPPQEQPAAGRRAGRRQDRAGRRAGAAHPPGRGARRAQGGAGLRARPRRARRRHALSRRLRGARQAGARRAREADARHPLHRRDSHAGRRRLRLGRHDGRRQPAEAGARLGRAALHRLDDVHRREAVVRQGPRAVAPLPEDRSARAVGGRDAGDPEGPARGLRAASRRRPTRTRRSRPRSRCRRGTCKDLHLPDKAIDVLDEAGAAQSWRPCPRGDRAPDGDRRRHRAGRRQDGARAGAGGLERRQGRAAAPRHRAEAR